jgi:transcriptional regulator with XRE-family HTH domain
MESSAKNIMQKRLVQLREERGWSQYDLAEKMYLTQKSISNIEKGNCTLPNLIQLADLYEVSLDYLVGRSEEKRFNPLGLDNRTVDIIIQLRTFSAEEKDMLLKHLELRNSLKSNDTAE